VRNRTVLEIMILTFTFVVAFMIVGIGIMILYVEATSPEADTALVASTLMNIVSGIVGALLGLLAGKNISNGDSKGGP